jgi:hypothetical protein
MKALVWTLRVLIGAVLLATGVGKLLDVPGFQNVLMTYQMFPDWSLPVIAIGFVVVEIRLAEELFVGRDIVRAAWLATAMHVLFTIFAAVTMLRGLDVPNCGCFGVFMARPLTWGTVGEDVVMTLLSSVLLVAARKLSQSSSGVRA